MQAFVFITIQSTCGDKLPFILGIFSRYYRQIVSRVYGELTLAGAEQNMVLVFLSFQLRF